MSSLDKKKSSSQIDDSSEVSITQDLKAKPRFTQETFEGDKDREEGSYTSKMMQKINKIKEGVKLGNHQRTLSSDENANLLQSNRNDLKDDSSKTSQQDFDNNKGPTTEDQDTTKKQKTINGSLTKGLSGVGDSDSDDSNMEYDPYNDSTPHKNINQRQQTRVCSVFH